MLHLKVCGNHYLEDVVLLSEYCQYIDYVGFIFTPVSKRVVTASQVKKWLELRPNLLHKAVAVFLDQSKEEIVEVIRETGIRIIQLHGSESIVETETLRRFISTTLVNQIKSIQIWKVIHVDEDGVAPYEGYLPFVDAILLDTKVKGVSGGTGQRFDWSLIPDIMKKVNQHQLPLYVAGGITPQNVSELVDTYTLHGIDLAGGVEQRDEQDRNRKDKQKLISLINEVKKDAINENN